MGKSAIKLGLFLAAGCALWLYLFSLSGGTIVPGKGAYDVQAVVPDSLGVPTHADVRAAGVRIGKVTAVRGLGSVTALKLQLDDDHAPVYRDARVLLRTKSVAGEPYVELDRGQRSAGALPDGGRLARDSAQESTQIDQILSELSAPRQRNLRRALAGLGGGLDSHGSDLNRLVEASAAALRIGARPVRTLAEQRAQVASLVDSLGRVSRALGDSRSAIRTLAARARTASEAVVARDAQLRETLAALPGFLRVARGTAGRLRTFSVNATPVMRDLRLAVQDLVPAVRDLGPSATAGRRVVRELQRFARAGTPAMTQLRPFASAATGAVPPLAASLREANPLLGYLAPYWRELSTWFANVGAAVKYTDAIGHVARIIPLVSRSSLPGTVAPEDLKLLERLEQLGGGLDRTGHNAYPAPGEAGQTKPFTGTYPRLSAEPPYARSGR